MLCFNFSTSVLRTVLCCLEKAVNLEYSHNISSYNITALLTAQAQHQHNHAGLCLCPQAGKSSFHGSTSQLESFNCSRISVQLPCLLLRTLLSLMVTPLFMGQRPQLNSRESRIKSVYRKHNW